MTRLEQHRDRRAKFRATQAQLEAARDDVIQSLSLPPSKAFKALLVYAINGPAAPGAMQSNEQALNLVPALTKRGILC